MLKNTILSKKRKKHVCFEYSNILIQSLVKNKLIKSSIRWYLNVHFTKIRKTTKINGKYNIPDMREQSEKNPTKAHT